MSVHAGELSTGFEAANKLYEQGKFKEAAAGYEALLQSGGVSAAIYYNLGNALFKSGQIGRAIAAYHLAEQLTPRDPDVRANLQFARNQIQGPTVSPTWWQRGLRRLSLTEWTVLTAGAIWIFLSLLALGQWRPTIRPALRNYVAMAGIGGVLLCGCLGLALHSQRHAGTAVVTVAEASVRQGPLDESPSVFVVHDGAELEVLDQKDDWLQVSTDARRIGWIHRDKVVLQGATHLRNRV